MQEGVDHDIADETDTFGIDAFAHQIGFGAALSRVEQVRHLIGQDAVDFFRHLAIVAAQSRLDMDDGNPFLDADQGAGQGRVYIAHHQHAGWLVQVDYRFEAPHDFCRLNRM